MDRDRLGRVRRPEQDRGLRPLHPVLPESWSSRALRVAMSEADWARFETLVEHLAGSAPTQARAHGMTLSHLMDEASKRRPEPGPLDWMEWERAKTLRLLKFAV